ncbi:MAG: membrane dipeptidase [Deltaproteobacteria bacterium]|nr:membrane dipeptidase [Deltaproteobacteria bacterium]
MVGLLLTPSSARGQTPPTPPEPVAAKPTASAKLPELSVDLHAHLFMEQALSWLFWGDFYGPLAADSWKDRLSSKVNPDSLDESGIGIVVVALMAHPLGAWDMRESLRSQIAAAERLVAERPNWQLARSAVEARRLLLAGKRVVVLSLEGAAGVLESEEDLREFVDEKGICVVQPLHLVDDRFGGVTTLDSFKYIGNPLGVADRLLDGYEDSHGLEISRRGLSPQGKRLVIELIKRGVWIDLAHAPDRALEELVPLIEAAGQPLLFSHTSLRRFRKAERALSDAMLARIKARRGVLGLVPSEEAYPELQVPARFCPRGCSPEQCQGSVSAFAAMYSAAAAVIGPEAIALGSDINGGMQHLGPACGTGTSLDQEQGLWHMGQFDELWQAMKTVGAPVPPLSESLAYYLDAWSRVRPVALAVGPEPPPLPSRDEVEGPGLQLRVGAGMGSGATTGAPPGLVLRLEGLVLKDLAHPIDYEPYVYFLDSELDLTQSLEDDGVPHLRARLSAVGMRATTQDTRVFAEALAAVARRHEPLDQALVLQLSAVRGAARLMPGFGKLLGHHNLFVQLSADALGYKHIGHFSDRPTLHGVHFIGGGLTLGATFYPEPDVALTFAGGLDADVNLTFPESEPAYQSDLELHGRLALDFIPSGVEPFFGLSWLANRESQAEDDWITAMRLHGGVLVDLF